MIPFEFIAETLCSFFLLSVTIFQKKWLGRSVKQLFLILRNKLSFFMILLTLSLTDSVYGYGSLEKKKPFLLKS